MHVADQLSVGIVIDDALRSLAGGSVSGLGTGGMSTKLQAADVACRRISSVYGFPAATAEHETACRRVCRQSHRRSPRCVSGLGTGGMSTKLQAADVACRAGINVIIASGSRSD
jgi:glutamate 5-kinase